jgi:glutamine synthetase
LEDGLSFKLGFELEFYLMSDVDLKNGMEDSAPEAYSRWSTASAMRDVRATCLEACVLALQDSGIDVEQFHAETGRHMYEIATGPLPALAAVDTYNQSREIVKRTALKHGFQATFLPKPFSTLQCLGQHIHISMHEEGDSVDAGKPRQDWFLAGMLHRLPLLCAYGMPSVESFQRFELFALAPWVSWGTENKDAPIRKIKDGHWELRTIDGTANVYLVAAAFIAAGILGLRQQQPLKWKDNRDFLQRLDTEAKEKLGIDTILPKNLEQALSLCRSDVMGLDLLLGKQVLEYYAMVKEHEQLKLASLSETERKRLYYDSF